MKKLIISTLLLVTSFSHGAELEVIKNAPLKAISGGKSVTTSKEVFDVQNNTVLITIEGDRDSYELEQDGESVGVATRVYGDAFVGKLGESASDRSLILESFSRPAFVTCCRAFFTPGRLAMCQENVLASQCKSGAGDGVRSFIYYDGKSCWDIDRYSCRPE